MEEELLELRRSRARRKPTKRARAEKRSEIIAGIAILVLILVTFVLCIIRMATEPAYAYPIPEQEFTVDDSRPIVDYVPETEAETKVETQQKTHEYSEILKNATAEDFRALEQVILNESVRAFGYEEEGLWECSVTVGEAVLNRVLDDRFPDTIHEVIYQKGQFCTKKLSGTEIQHEIVCDVISHLWYEGRTMLPSTEYTCFATKKQSMCKDHVFFGKRKNGKASKGHWYGKLK